MREPTRVAPHARRALASELDRCREIRHTVFVQEQGVPADLEVDGRDSECEHFVACCAGRVVGTARLRRVGGELKVERVAVLPRERRTGAGRALMRAVEDAARECGVPRLLLSAQEAVVSFYRELGYRSTGEPFVEAGIPHQRMIKPL